MKTDGINDLYRQYEKNYVLTSKEREMLELLVEGLSDKEISTKMNIKVSTVRTHIGNIFGKLNVNNRKKLIIKILSENT